MPTTPQNLPISGLPTNAVPQPNDLIETLDVSNTANNATGENSKSPLSSLVQAALPVMVAAGSLHMPGLVGDPGAVAHATPYLWGDDAQFHPFTGPGISYSGGVFTVSGGGGGAWPGPGGSSGDIQTNNGSGGLGGLATVPVAKGGTGLVAMGTALQVLRVNSGATALEYATVSGGGGTPGGTNGQVQYNNAGAFGGLASVPVASGGTGLTALGTPLQVLRVNSGATALEYAAASGGAGNTQTLFNGFGLTPVASTTSPTSILQGGTVVTGTQAAGGVTFPTSLLSRGCSFEFFLFGLFSNPTGTPNFRWIFRVNGTIVMQSSLVGIATANTNAPWLSYNSLPRIFLQSAPAVGANMIGNGTITLGGTTAVTEWLNLNGDGSSGPYASVPVDLSPATTTIDVQVTPSVSSASHGVTCMQAQIRLILPT